MSKPQKNYFVVNRGLLGSDRWLSEPFTRGQAWIDLFGLAQHTSGFIRVRGIKIEVKRGQLAYAQRTLAERWKWSRGKVKRYLDELEKDGNIVPQTSHRITLITVEKYNFWQGCAEKQYHKRTTNSTNKKNVNKDNKYTYGDKSPKDDSLTNETMFEEPTIELDENGDELPPIPKKYKNKRKLYTRLIGEYKKHTNEPAPHNRYLRAMKDLVDLADKVADTEEAVEQEVLLRMGVAFKYYKKQQWDYPKLETIAKKWNQIPKWYKKIK